MSLCRVFAMTVGAALVGWLVDAVGGVVAAGPRHRARHRLRFAHVFDSR